MASKRIYDENGWFEVPDNPLLRAGIFEYVGRNLPGAPDPDKIYRVWRSEEELEDPACIDSFKLLPWIDDHPPGLLGEEDMGYTPAEDKGIHGTIGERVYYRDGVLRGNIKLFSSTLADLVADGKKELSPGYRARYDYNRPGIADRGIAKGKPYDVIQLRLRGNHLASVGEGRQGPSVAVLDGITLDAKDIIKMADENTLENNEVTQSESAGTTVSLEEGIKIFLTMLPVLQQLVAASGGAAPTEEPAPAETTVDNAPSGGDGENGGTVDNDDPNSGSTADNDDGKDNVNATLDSMDKRLKGVEGRDTFKSLMRELHQRDSLAESLSWHIGTFDSKDMTTSEVAAYGLKKLNISAPKGQEMAYLNGYLKGAGNGERPAAHNEATLDSVDESSAIGKYLKGE